MKTSSTSYNKSYSQLDTKLDEQFVQKLKLIEERYIYFNKHIQIRIEKWVEKLLLCDNNTIYRKRRNQYINLLFEMVSRQFICAMFLKMPPSEVPNLSDSQYKMLLQQIKSKKIVQSKKEHLISIKKLEGCQGDVETCRATPCCQTDRQNEQEILNQIENQLMYGNKSRIKQESKWRRDQIDKCSLDSQKKEEITCLLGKIQKILVRNQEKLDQKQEFHEILSSIRPHLDKSEITPDRLFSSQIFKMKQNTAASEKGDQSEELRISEGINRMNLQDLVSPRGTTQVQYLKAAFQY